ncbi:MAG: hypothetical protein WCN98_09855, partial [Verrucomicrobiaceae bacterium]
MKPHLIKFSCPACGTRLAVPLSMAGAQDHCPKCSAVVAAPMPTVEPAVPATPELLPLKTEIKDPPAHGAAETKDTA